MNPEWLGSWGLTPQSLWVLGAVWGAVLLQVACHRPQLHRQLPVYDALKRFTSSGSSAWASVIRVLRF